MVQPLILCFGGLMFAAQEPYAQKDLITAEQNVSEQSQTGDGQEPYKINSADKNGVNSSERFTGSNDPSKAGDKKLSTDPGMADDETFTRADELAAGTPVADTWVDSDDNAADSEALPLSQQVEDLKQTVLELNRDLLILEEELLFPANTQVALFISMDVGEFFHLDAVKVKIDDQLVASHLYTERQVDALYRGGVQRLFIGNLKSGRHEITAFFTGKGPQGRDYKRGTTIALDKEQEPKMLELRIVDSTAKLQPVFDIKEWQL